MGINLNNPGDVMGGINALAGKVKPFLSMAMPVLKRISPKVKAATGYSVEELYDELNGITNEPPRAKQKPAAQDLYNKYKNL